MKYQEGFKYQLVKDEYFQTSICPPFYIKTKFYTISPEGIVKGVAGYAWDGSTWAIDTEESQAPSVLHDILCQAIQEGHLNRKWKTQADVEYMKLCIANGMFRIRAGVRFIGLQTHNWQDTKPKKVVEVPNVQPLLVPEMCHV